MATLTQYAAVVAAKAEGIPLEDATSAEGIAATAWPRIDLSWKKRLASDGELAAAYEDELGRAEQRWARRIRPIDEDVSAWVSWLDVYSRSTSPLALLQQHGLRMSDLSRLSKAWSRKLSGDPALRQRMGEVWNEGPGPLPAIVVENGDGPPGRLVANTGASSVAAAAVQDISPAGTPMEVALLLAELDVFPARTEETWARAGLLDVDKRASWQRAWLHPADPGVARDVRALRAHFAEQLRLGRTDLETKVRPEVFLPCSVDPYTTPPATLQQHAEEVMLLHADDDLGSTPSPQGYQEHDADATNETMELAFLADDRPVFPFEARPTPPPAFLAAMEADRKQRAGSPRPAPMYETAPLPPLSRETLLPKPKTTALTLPELTLEQYASLRAELSVPSRDAPPILARYGIDDEAALKTLDLRFNEQMQRDPTLLTRFAQAVRFYQDWIETQVRTP